MERRILFVQDLLTGEQQDRENRYIKLDHGSYNQSFVESYILINYMVLVYIQATIVFIQGKRIKEIYKKRITIDPMN